MCFENSKKHIIRIIRLVFTCKNILLLLIYLVFYCLYTMTHNLYHNDTTNHKSSKKNSTNCVSCFAMTKWGTFLFCICVALLVSSSMFTWMQELKNKGHDIWQRQQIGTCCLIALFKGSQVTTLKLLLSFSASCVVCMKMSSSFFFLQVAEGRSWKQATKMHLLESMNAAHWASYGFISICWLLHWMLPRFFPALGGRVFLCWGWIHYCTLGYLMLKNLKHKSENQNCPSSIEIYKSWSDGRKLGPI